LDNVTLLLSDGVTVKFRKKGDGTVPQIENIKCGIAGAQNSFYSQTMDLLAFGTNMQIYIYTDIHIYKYIDIQIYRYTEIHMYLHIKSFKCGIAGAQNGFCKVTMDLLTFGTKTNIYKYAHVHIYMYTSMHVYRHVLTLSNEGNSVVKYIQIYATNPSIRYRRHFTFFTRKMAPVAN